MNATKSNQIKLPYQLVFEALIFPFIHLGAVIRLGLIPVALYMVIYLLPDFPDTMKWLQPDYKIDESSAFYFLGRTIHFLLTGFIGVVFLAPFAVLWHQYILLDNHQAGWRFFQYNKTVWYYVFYAFVIEILMMYLIFEINTLAELSHSQFHGVLIMLISFLISTYLVQKLSMILPATAIGVAQPRWNTIWKFSKGNSFRLFAAFWILVICAALIIVAVYYGTALILSRQSADNIFETPMANLLVIWVVISGITYLSFAFRWLKAHPTDPIYADEHAAIET